MKTTLKRAMMASISETLETMFFLSLEFFEGENLEESGMFNTDKIIMCKLDFKGDFSGFFVLYIPEKLLLDMTQNFLGIDENEVFAEHINGTIAEIINILAGNTFSLFDKKMEFTLGLPEHVDTTDPLAFSPGPGMDEILVIPETTEGLLALKVIFENSGK